MRTAAVSCLVALIATLTVSAPATAGDNKLYAVTDTNTGFDVQILDTRNDAVVRRMPLRKRLMPINQAIRLFSAIPPWVGDPVEETSDLRAQRKAGRKTAEIAVNPLKIAVDHNHLYGVVGEEAPSFVFDMDMSSGHVVYHDFFNWHSFAVYTARRRVFLSDFRSGVFWADPGMREARRVDDRYHKSIRFLQIENGKARADQATRADAAEMGEDILRDWCTLMTSDPSGKLLYVATMGTRELPTLAVFDIATTRLVEVVRLKEEWGAFNAGLGIARDGSIYAVVHALHAGDPKMLSLYRFDGRSGRFIGATQLDLSTFAPGGDVELDDVAVAGDNLFLELKNHLVVLALPGLKLIATADLREPGLLNATPDGRKIYLDANGVFPVTPADDHQFVIGPKVPIADVPHLLAIDPH